jgi:tRNA A-37 threonylcarbamoyl transferase component Bud32
VKVFSDTRQPLENIDSLEWLRTVDKAAASPLKVIKGQYGMKRTLQVDLWPWGNVCLQDFRWNLKRIILSPFRKSRGERIWRYAGFISQRGVSVLEPLLFLEVKKGFFVIRSVIVTPWLEEKIDLGRIVGSEELQQDYDVDTLLDRAVRMTARLHNLGFLHGDLKWSNFFVTGENLQKLILTDLDGLKYCNSQVLQGKDYARFVLSALVSRPEWISAETLIQRYLNRREGVSRTLEQSLRWHIKRKQKRYLKK